MSRYEVKCWLTVEADSELEAEKKADDFADRIAEESGIMLSIEGEGSTYLLDNPAI